MFLVNLGDFARDTTGPFRTEKFRHLPESLYETVWRLVENHSSSFFGEGFEFGLTALFDRKETFEAETVARETGTHQSGYEGRWAGKGLDLNPLLHTGTDQQKTGVGYSGSAGIAYQGHIQTGKNPVPDDFGSLVLIELVVGFQTAVDVIMFQKD